MLVYKMRTSIDDCVEGVRNRHWAERAWEEVCQGEPARGFSTHYAQGFKEGFATFIYEGGTGLPPPLPPRRYRSVQYQNPQGYRAIEDWFAGYRHGVRVAEQGNYRRWVTGPSAMGVPITRGEYPASPSPEAAVGRTQPLASGQWSGARGQGSGVQLMSPVPQQGSEVRDQVSDEQCRSSSPPDR
jgi:hypothetical protein